MTRRRLLAVAALAAIVLAGAWIADRIRPPNLDRLAEGSVVVAAADGTLLRGFTNRAGRWRLGAQPDAVDPRYLRLLVAIEDQRFWTHAGIDPIAIARAAGQMMTSGRVVSGASTLTMQAARLLEPRPRGWLAKLTQAARALQLERRHSKAEILGMYLTLAPFGGNLEGIRAAALAYFGHEPNHLSWAEAALLVALPQSPERLRPDRHAAAARQARDRILERGVAAGVIAADEAAEARAQPVPTARLPLPMHAPHLAERVAREAPPGRVVTTTIDARLQLAFAELAAGETRWIEDGAQIAILAVETQGRRVRAWVGGVDYFGPRGQIDLARARRSPGSALKPFIYALAFEDGIAAPETLIEDAPMRFGDWSPRNFDRGYQGRLSVRQALQQSLNVPAVAMLDRVGPARFVEALRDAGAVLRYRGARVTLPVALGGLGISLADMTMLYAALGDGGMALPLSVRADDVAPPGRRLVTAEPARLVLDILAGTAQPDGWAARALTGGRRIAYKTGTSYGFRDAWAMGVSARWTVGVWVGRADGTARPGNYGRNTAAPLLFRAFDLLAPDGQEQQPAPAITAPGLRFFAAGDPLPALTRGRPPRIMFPPEGATLELEDPDDGLTLRAEGEGPLTWLAEGVPLPRDPTLDQTIWHPDGEGFARLTVVDRQGRAASVRVRVVFER